MLSIYRSISGKRHDVKISFALTPTILDLGKLLAVLIVMTGIDSFVSPTQLAFADGCENYYEGVQHCSEGNVHYLRIDLKNPYVRVQTVLSTGPSSECNSVNSKKKDSSSNCPHPYPLERITDMLKRYQGKGAVAIINTDYFGPDRDHGAEGLTVRNGVRLDGVEHGVDLNGRPYPSRSLAISRDNKAVIRIVQESSGQIKKNDLENTFYNTVSGAPIIVSGGKVVNSNCPGPYPPTGYPCSREFQSAAGLTNDGHLILVTAKKNAGGIAKFLVDRLQVHTALKFDGGGSARLAWLDGTGNIKSFDPSGENRRVAEGLLIFSSPLIKKGNVSGLVKYASGQPVSGATVQFTGNGVSKTTTSNTSGAYQFPDVPAGLATITASKNGVSRSINVTVRANASVSAPEIKLPISSGGIGGYVSNVAGQSVNGATVEFSGGGFIQTIKTNERGYYDFPNVPAGPATITASKDGVKKSVEVVVLANAHAGAPDIIRVQL